MQLCSSALPVVVRQRAERDATHAMHAMQRA
jgi:hypothetical protein